MKFAVLIFAGLIALAACDPTYSQFEQPDYSVVTRHDSYELRRYSSSNWIRTQYSSAVFDEDLNMRAYRRLITYLGNLQRNGSPIQMTVPVLTTVEPRTCSVCNITFTMHFFVPSDLVETAPATNAPLLELVEMPEMEVYVRRFGGLVRSLDVWTRTAVQLRAELNQNGIEDYELEMDRFYAVTYDNPWQVTNRRNEVWIAKFGVPAPIADEQASIEE